MGMRARLDRGASKLVGALTILVAIALIGKLAPGPVIGGAIMLYAGLILFPVTRERASFGVFGFTKLRRFGAQFGWFLLTLLGVFLMVVITEPWT